MQQTPLSQSLNVSLSHGTQFPNIAVGPDANQSALFLFIKNSDGGMHNWRGAPNALHKLQPGVLPSATLPFCASKTTRDYLAAKIECQPR